MTCPFVEAVAALVFTTIRREDLYREAVARAKASPAVQAELGSPVHEGWWMLGRLRTRGSWGIARFWVPLKGTVKNGTLYVWANKSAGRWTYERWRWRWKAGRGGSPCWRGSRLGEGQTLGQRAGSFWVFMPKE